MEQEKLYYGYTKSQLYRMLVCFIVFLFFGAIEASQGVYYALLKKAFDIPYIVQGWIVSMASFSFIIGSPIVGWLMTIVGVKPIVLSGFVAYILAYSTLFFITCLGLVFPSLFIEGMGCVLLDVGMNTLSTVLFTAHRGVMMNLLHFFYGLGSAIGPSYSSWMLRVFDMGYRGVFIGLIIPSIFAIVFITFSNFSLVSDADRSDSSAPEQKSSFVVWQSFLNPMVWVLGVLMGAVYAIESVTVNWAPLYMKDLYDFDPETDGAHWLSLFFSFYTIARLYTGFIVDWLKDAESILLFSITLILFYLACFAIGRKAIWVLCFSGFFISPFYPTSITLSMAYFKGDAKNRISVILCIAAGVNPAIQVIVGIINGRIGERWGYRVMSIAMCVLMICCVLIVLVAIKKQQKSENQQLLIVKEEVIVVNDLEEFEKSQFVVCYQDINPLLSNNRLLINMQRIIKGGIMASVRCLKKSNPKVLCRYFAAEDSDNVTNISDEKAFETFKFEEKPCLAMFSSQNCDSCKKISPLFSHFSTMILNANFVKVDIDTMQTVAEEEYVTSVPTFKLYKKGHAIYDFVGANGMELMNMIEAANKNSA